MTDPLGPPITDQLMQATFEPILNAFLEKLREDGFDVQLTHDESGYLIVFGKPGEPQSTVIGETAIEALQDLTRNMTQLGLLPRELREMQLQLDSQLRPIRDAVSEQLAEDLKKALGQ